MSVFLTPDLKPFFGGTYFPPTSRWGRPGFVDILQQIAQVWRADRAKIEQSAESVTEQLRGSIHASVSASRALGRRSAADRRAVPVVVRFPPRRLRRRAEVSATERAAVPAARIRTDGRRRALQIVLATLRAMALGGMRDHIGGGFHRYSVDAAWRVPHFEKMLYDQAQLVLAYVEAAQASGDPFYAEVAEDTLALRHARDDRQGGRLLLRRRRRQRAARARERRRAAQIRRRVLSVARRRARRAARRRRADRQAALRHRTGRQRARRSAAGIHRQESPVRRPRRRGARRGNSARPTTRSLESWPRTADDVSRTAWTAASASRRQGADRLERPDDRRVRAGSARPSIAWRRRRRRRAAVPGRGSTRRVVHPRVHVGRARPARCCADFATATPRSTPTPKTTRI